MKDNELDNEVIIIFSTGICTYVYKDGRIYGEGITEFDFHKSAGEFPKLDIRAMTLPVSGNRDSESLKNLLECISDEIQKYVSLGQTETATEQPQL